MGRDSHNEGGTSSLNVAGVPDSGGSLKGEYRSAGRQFRACVAQ